MSTRADLTAAAKFRAVCDRCGAKKGPVTAFTLHQWTVRHEQEHREEDR